jgi:hypothetical protein
MEAAKDLLNNSYVRGLLLIGVAFASYAQGLPPDKLESFANWTLGTWAGLIGITCTALINRSGGLK